MNRRPHCILPLPVLLMGLCALMLAGAAPASAQQLAFTIFVGGYPLGAIPTGFAFAGNKFVGAVADSRTNTDYLFSTDLNGGHVQRFAPNLNLPGPNPDGEHCVAGSLGLGGFPKWDIYVAAGDGVLHITNDGTTSDMFVTSLAGPVRSIRFDAVGTFGHDMLVSTHGGQVYRVNGSGIPTLLVSLGGDIEAMDVAPIGAGFGGYDGQLIAATEALGGIFAISPSGAVTKLQQVFFPIESINFVPMNVGESGSLVEGLYIADYPSDIVKASANQFSAFKGDAIISDEVHIQEVFRMHWNGSAFEISLIGSSSTGATSNAEAGIFVTPAMITNGSGCPVIEPTPDPFCPPVCHRVPKAPRVAGANSED